MKPIGIIIALVFGLVVGFWVGSSFTSMQDRNAVLAGPYSDNIIPARQELGQAITKLQSGDTNVIEHLRVADSLIGKAEQWSKHFVGVKDEGTH
jgi:amino acid permease